MGGVKGPSVVDCAKSGVAAGGKFDTASGLY